MSLPLKDVGKLSVSAEAHSMVQILASEKGMGQLAWVRWLVERTCAIEARKAILRSDEIRRTGIEQTFRESQFHDGMGSE
jgi:hypothetical protein